ncbi:YpoC family protein [Peribacillus glennii]|uniref:YpoC-like domain-containing protein n=1 Tax=Peribacillus glennii TaxID=2303991 RepID=A0A372LIP2_9BACI|nr:hypothetical protein [Peribacillus glennii]RFU65506.1 hypothetical protein D0466_06390 [Peribacillus glennii]
MSGLIRCRIPDELKHPLFFSIEAAEISRDGLQEWSTASDAPYFVYELLYWNGLGGYRPWEAVQPPLLNIFAQWEGIKQRAGLFFSERKADDARLYMIDGLSLFMSALFWLHNQPVSLNKWKTSIATFPFKPVNTADRLSFILSRPGLYHSFIQLGQLFVELEKQYYKKEIVSKKTSKPGA